MISIKMVNNYIKLFPQNQFNSQVGTYNNFSHPIGGGQPPQLPTSPPTYESVSDLPLLPPPLLFPTDGQTNRVGARHSGKSSLFSLLAVLCVLYFIKTHIRPRLALGLWHLLTNRILLTGIKLNKRFETV